MHNVFKQLPLLAFLATLLTAAPSVYAMQKQTTAGSSQSSSTVDQKQGALKVQTDPKEQKAEELVYDDESEPGFDLLVKAVQYAFGYASHPSTLVQKVSLWGADNFHEVVVGRLYRSAQLSAESLEKYMKQYGIKSVINLRGAWPQKQWWREEKEIVLKNGGTFYNIAMNANVVTPPSKLAALKDIFAQAKEPILIHCKAGADRTGEGAGFWLICNGMKEKALDQLDVRFGHNSYMYPAKRELIRNLTYASSKI